MKAITESKGLIVNDHRGFVDESGCRRYTMTYEQLQALMASTEQKYYYQQKVADARVVECVLMREVFSRKEMYVSLIELEPATMMQYELVTGYFGELYRYDYCCKNDPSMAERIRAMNPNKQK